MKRIVVLLLLAGMILFTARHKKCKIDRPKNLNPIDWNNYNDVNTVYWNYSGECSDFTIDCSRKNIKVCGWVRYMKFTEFTLGDILRKYEDYKYSTNDIEIRIHCDNPTEQERLKMKFDTTDVRKKCYIIGELVIFDISDNDCCFNIPEIVVYNADDIVFE